VLVKVHATTVNRTDGGFRSGKPFIVRFSAADQAKLAILGSEFAGVVQAVGSGVTSFEVGDRVFGFSDPGGPGREDWPGAHAEYVSIPEHGPLARCRRTCPTKRSLPVPK
jgi:NADPH:quinone reductase-like Zn-dependent oxidoreductase